MSQKSTQYLEMREQKSRWIQWHYILYFVGRNYKTEFCDLKKYKIYSIAHHTLIILHIFCDFQQGKKLPLDWKEDKGEVTDEDEGAETSKKKEKPKRVPLCKELSDLVSLARCRFVSFLTSKEIRMLLCHRRLFHDLISGLAMHKEKQ
jgi:hypothetical protein